MDIARCIEENIARAGDFLELASRYGSPLYVLEPAVLQRRAHQLRDAFETTFPDARVYYALKSNNMDEIIRVFVEEGLGIDVSSGLELEQALAADAVDIVFSGPGKTDAELDAALSAAERVVVLVDSIRELERLQRRALSRNVAIRAGARVSTAESGRWQKFGIPLGQLGRLLKIAESSRHVRFEGLQFHVSWLLEPSLQVAFVRRLGDSLSRLQSKQRAMINFIDVGGGFWPETGEWLHANPDALPGPALVTPRVSPATSIEGFAAALAEAFEEHIFPLLPCSVHVEPGRWLCHDAMHIAITVVDKKAHDLIIADAGTNAIGWERFESDYFPLINLSRPSMNEQLCTVYGSLCTPHDVWGFSYYGEGIEEGDVLLLPHQGAYTYSLRQHFIKPLPRVAILERGSRARSARRTNIEH